MTLQLARPSVLWLALTVALAVLVILALVYRLVVIRRRQQSSSLLEWVVAGLGLGAALLLVAAASDPYLLSRADRSRSRLVVVADVSSSVQRAAPSWREVRGQIVARLKLLVRQVDPLTRSRTTCSIVTCAGGHRRVAEGLPLAELPRRFSSIGERSFPPTEASNLQAGLDAAARQVERAGGRGAVLLISDGHQTEGDGPAAARRLAADGIPVSVLPVAGKSPQVGLYAADLPAQVESGSISVARLFLLNRSSRSTAASLHLGLPGEEAAPRPVQLPAGAEWLRVRQPLLLEELGLQAFDLVLQRDDEVVAGRRFFTMVTRPPQVLALGDAGWAHGLPDTLQITRRLPHEITAAEDVAGFDLLVLNAVAAEDLPAAAIGQMAVEVVARSTGMLVLNGPHHGGPDARTTFMSYDDTAIEPLLPVTTSPKQKGRHVVILLDASGSMQGWRLGTGKTIAGHIISQLLEDDSLDLIVFTGGAHHLVSDEKASAMVKDRARQQLGSISAGGGTDPSDALRLIADRRFDRCGLFFISDGGFGRLAARPDCQITVFAMDHTQASIPRILRQLAEPIPVGRSFDPAAVKIGFLEEERARFEPGRYLPIPGIDALQRGWLLLPEQPTALYGNAVTFPRRDAQVAAVRPRLAQPILAFRDSDGGTVAAFTSELVPEYSRGRDPALSRWIKRLLGFAERDRYGIAMTDHGSYLTLRLTLLAGAGRVPQVHGLTARIDVPGRPGSPVSLRPDPQLPGVFAGDLARPEVSSVTSGTLVVRETGPEAPQRAQLIPFRVPPALPAASQRSREAWCSGLDEAVLRAITEAGGGSYDPSQGLVSAAGTERGRSISLRAPLLVIAALLYLAQIALRRLQG